MSAKEKILEAAGRLFSENGYEETSLRDVCEAANCSEAAIKQCFRSKAGLYQALFEAIFEDFGQPLENMVDEVCDAESWEEALRKWVWTLLRCFTADSEPYRWIRKLIAREHSHPSPKALRLFDRVLRIENNRLMELLEMGLPEGSGADAKILWHTTVTSQVTCYLHRDPPWNSILFPQRMDIDLWREFMAQHVVESVTMRLSYRGRPAKCPETHPMEKRFRKRRRR